MRARRTMSIPFVVMIAVLLAALGSATDAQMSGARAADEYGGSSYGPARAPATLSHEAIENYITIEGSSEIRLDPTSMRIVFALMAEGETASECQTIRLQREQEFVASVEATGIASEAIVIDFIAILPVYEWQIETQEGVQTAVERKVGHQLQSNVHVEVATDEEAEAVLEAAFGLGVSDVIAFDYWNDEIDQSKQEARASALAAAQAKADLLLGALFEETPRPINIHESTQAVYPRSLYASFQSDYAQGLSIPYRNDQLPRLEAAKPKNTYFRGLLSDADIQTEGLPLRPQISVTSTVRLYYEAPCKDEEDSDDD